MTRAKLSIITPARNVVQYVPDAIRSVLAERRVDLEHIIVDDGSDDGTREAALRSAEDDRRVRVYSNPGRGKVSALNEGYKHATGSLVTTLDGDDTLDPTYFRSIEAADLNVDAAIRDYWVVDEKLQRLGKFVISRALLQKPFEEVYARLISVPRACWTISRELAERVFPIPKDLPFEDVWFSLVVKRFAVSIAVAPAPTYYYRQHAGQTFGGVLNYRSDIVRFRARRLARYAELLPSLSERFELDAPPDLSGVHAFYSLMARPHVTLLDIARACLSTRDRLSVFAYRKLWPLMAIVKRVQWLLASRGRRSRVGSR